VQRLVDETRELIEQVEGGLFERAAWSAIGANLVAIRNSSADMTYAKIGALVGQSTEWVRVTVTWITQSKPGRTPFSREGRPSRGDAAAAARALADPMQRETSAPHIAKAMEDPEVREAVAKHMTPGAARDLSDRAGRDHPARRKLDEPLGVPEPKVSFLTRMAGPTRRLSEAADELAALWEMYVEEAHEDDIYLVREDIHDAIAKLSAVTTDWSVR